MYLFCKGHIEAVKQKFTAYRKLYTDTIVHIDSMMNLNTHSNIYMHIETYILHQCHYKLRVTIGFKSIQATMKHEVICFNYDGGSHSNPNKANNLCD